MSTQKLENLTKVSEAKATENSKKKYAPGVHQYPQTTVRLQDRVKKMLVSIAEDTDKTQTDIVSCAIENFYALYCLKQSLVTKAIKKRKTHPKKHKKPATTSTSTND